jgi:hypothetical protein
MGSEEFLYEDVKNKTGRNKEGYQKIRRCCEIAAADDLEYIWVDTCCIDKSSSAELSEAINSMFRWYMESDVCYTYLFDIATSSAETGLVSLEQLRQSRWITRGWTLHELIAPGIVRFFSRDWAECGNRENLAPILYHITNIDLDILQRSSSANDLGLLYSLCIAKRMSWAATRQTTRPEDAAYCLLGLFNVNMVMLYGEGGPRAFHRLQEEIMKYSTDQKFLAWSPSKQNWSRMPVLTDSPAAFHDGSRILPIEEGHYFGMTSRVLQLTPRLFDFAELLGRQDPCLELPLEGADVIMLSCIYADDPSGQLGLIIRRVEGEGTSSLRFARAMQFPVIIPLEKVRLWFSTHMADGTPVLPPPQFNFVESESVESKSSGPKVEEYLNAIQRVVEQPKIYIAYVITQSRQRDMDNAYYVLTLSTTMKSRRYSSLVCLDESTSCLNKSWWTLRAREIVGTVGQHDVEVHLTEQYDSGITGPNLTLCRAVFSRSTQDPSRLKVELRCSCGRECGHQNPKRLRSGMYIRCDGYRIHVTATLRAEQRSGRKYNLINFEVDHWAADENPLALP